MRLMVCCCYGLLLLLVVCLHSHPALPAESHSWSTLHTLLSAVNLSISAGWRQKQTELCALPPLLCANKKATFVQHRSLLYTDLERICTEFHLPCKKALESSGIITKMALMLNIVKEHSFFLDLLFLWTYSYWLNVLFYTKKLAIWFSIS